jgi:hypothetical protein
VVLSEGMINKWHQMDVVLLEYSKKKNWAKGIWWIGLFLRSLITLPNMWGAGYIFFPQKRDERPNKP